MGLTGGVKSHRLSGQISPYCKKKTSLALRVLRAYVSPKSENGHFEAFCTNGQPYLRKPKRDNPKIFCKSQKIFQIAMFFQKSLSKGLPNPKNYYQS